MVSVGVLGCAITAMSAGCTGPGCPTTAEEAAQGSFPAATSNTVVALGHLTRIVPSPDTGTVGYDLSLEVVLLGESGQVMELTSVIEVPGVSRGPVLIVAERTGEHTLKPGGCRPLHQIHASDLPGAVLLRTNEDEIRALRLYSREDTTLSRVA